MTLNPLLKEKLSQDFSISHSKDLGFKMNHHHFHDNYEILFVLSGSLQYFVGSKLYGVPEGSILVLNQSELHGGVVPDRVLYDRYVVVFKPEYIRDLSTPFTPLLSCFQNRSPDFSHLITLKKEDRILAQSLCEKLLSFYQSVQYGADVYQKLTLAELLIHLNRLYEGPPCPRPHGKENAYERVVPVLSYIEAHLSDALFLDDLSHVFHISKQHLCFLFKNATGLSVTEYVIQLRISKARKLLRKNMPVSEVCESVGFRNLSHFIRTFKKSTGMSPKQYAKSEQ